MAMICINKKCGRELDDNFLYCPYCGRKQVKERKKLFRTPNGYGSVIKLSERRRRPWAVRVTDKFIDGKQLYRYISYHETKTEAEKALAAEQICPTSPKANITLEQLYLEWKETPAFKGISKQTQDNYTSAYKHLKPLHKVIFTNLRTAHMQKVIDGATRKVNGEDVPLSYSSKSKIKLLLNLLYKYAMQNDITSKNYAEFIKIKRVDKKEKEIFTDLEIETLLKNDTVPYVDVILILIYTGMRISELLELTKFAVDFKNDTITGGLKTDAGRDRTIPIHPKIKGYLKSWYDKSNGILIFKNDHEPITPNYFRKFIYYPLLEQLNITRRTPHATRHTFATLLARNGADTNAIKNILGHTDYAFTSDTYTHVDVEFLKTAIEKI